MLAPEVEYIEQGQIFHGSIPHVMGTRFDMIVVGVPYSETESVWAAVQRTLESLDAMLNRFSPTSEVSRLNEDSAISGQGMSRELYEILQLASEYKDSTLGLFDVAGGHMDDIEISERCTVSLYGNKLDFGGFAKGFALRKIKTLLDGAGVKSAYVDFGGSGIMAIGRHPFGDCWKVTLTDPYTGGKLDDIDLKDCTLSTSGNTGGYTGHIVNPHTSEPVTDRRLATVLAEDPLDAEVLSTTFMMTDDGQRERILSRFGKIESKIYKLQ